MISKKEDDNMKYVGVLHDKDIYTHDSPEVIDEETGKILEEKGSRYKSGDPVPPYRVMFYWDN
jgi:hypothetical protein